MSDRLSNLIAEADLAEAVAVWLGYLGAERHLAAKTLDAYARDITQFLSVPSSSSPPTLATRTRSGLGNSNHSASKVWARVETWYRVPP